MNTEPSEREEAPERVWLLNAPFPKNVTYHAYQSKVEDDAIEYVRAGVCLAMVRAMRNDYEARRASESHPAFAHHYAVCRNTADEIIDRLEAAANSVKDSEEGDNR